MGDTLRYEAERRRRLVRVLAPLSICVAAVLFVATAVSCGSSKAIALDPYALQRSDLGAHFKQKAAHPVPNALAIKQGTSAATVRRYGRVGGYERQFRARGLAPNLRGIKSRVVATRTAAGSHGAFLYSIARTGVGLSKRNSIHRLVLPRVGSESRCYYLDDTRVDARVYFCIWRQGRLIGELFISGFLEDAGPALLRPFERILNKQASRMASFR